MIDGREVTSGSYADRSVNDSRDGMRAMSIEEFKIMYHVRYDRWLRKNETAIVKDARYQGTYTITNEQTGHLMKFHLWTVDWLNWNGTGATERCILKVKTHCWSVDRLGDPMDAFKGKGRYAVTTDYDGNVIKINEQKMQRNSY